MPEWIRSEILTLLAPGLRRQLWSDVMSFVTGLKWQSNG